MVVKRLFTAFLKFVRYCALLLKHDYKIVCSCTYFPHTLPLAHTSYYNPVPSSPLVNNNIFAGFVTTIADIPNATITSITIRKSNGAVVFADASEIKELTTSGTYHKEMKACGGKGGRREYE